MFFLAKLVLDDFFDKLKMIFTKSVETVSGYSRQNYYSEKYLWK